MGRQESEVLAPCAYQTSHIKSPSNQLYSAPTEGEVARGDFIISPTKRGPKATLSCPQQRTLLNKLSKYITRDAKLVAGLGWEASFEGMLGQGDLTNLEKFHHPSLRILRPYQHQGARMVLTGGSGQRGISAKLWTMGHISP